MYAYLFKHPHLFPSILGITFSQFKVLVPRFSHALHQAENEAAYRKKRCRAPGAGRKPSIFISDAAKLFFILFYYKVYPTYRLAQVLFRLDIHQLYFWKEFLEPVLFETLGYQLNLPKVKARCLDKVLEICPALSEFIVDATERQIRRPKDNVKQEFYYSGKSKCHSVKNHILVHPRNHRILSVSQTVEGKRHDKTLLEDDPILTLVPPHATSVADTGYLGMDKTAPWIKFVIPRKKPPGGELTSEDKANNRQISAIRVRAEHPFAYLKHFNVLKQTFRNTINKAHTPFVTLACLYNFTRTHH
ncbi:hypothetical protein AUJ38_03830 [bacterium CG1_02_42_9]|nr:MAG: hypothetical protein AUJ38_03830 [bacterium CG1_02_42_9]